MKKSPLFIIEEHHEAFFVWNYCIHKGFIKPDHNCLLHVDSHSDFSIPTLKTSIDSLNGNIQKIHEFTYDELSISTFLIAAVYQGIFNQVTWLDQVKNVKSKELFSPDKLLKGGHDFSIKDKKYVEAFVQARGNDGKTLMVKKLTPKIKVLQYAGRKDFSYHYMSTNEKLKTEYPIVLDIDLDYFSCISNPRKTTELKLEISQETYTLLKDPYHPVNLLMTKPTVKKIENRYFAFFSEPDKDYVSETKVDKIEIVSRIDSFVDFLRYNHVQPQIIDICRSRYSGYTPLDQWEFIENNLIKALKKLYNCEVFSLNEISTELNQVL